MIHRVTTSFTSKYWDSLKHVGKNDRPTHDADFDFSALAEGALDDAAFSGRQRHLQIDKQLDVGLLFEQIPTDDFVGRRHPLDHAFLDIEQKKKQQ